MNTDQPKRSKKQAQEDPVTQPAQPVTPRPAPDPSQPSGTDPSELAKKLEGMVYEDFDPLLLKQNEAAQKLEFETYDAALDEFYAKVLCLLSFLVRCVQAMLAILMGAVQIKRVLELHLIEVCQAIV